MNTHKGPSSFRRLWKRGAPPPERHARFAPVAGEAEGSQETAWGLWAFPVRYSQPEPGVPTSVTETARNMIYLGTTEYIPQNSLEESQFEGLSLNGNEHFLEKPTFKRPE